MIRSAALFAGIGLAAIGLAGIAPQPAEAQRVQNVLIVYGEDPCPTSNGEEIVVCARLPESDRYRIPPELRQSREMPADQAWASRAETIEYVGRGGTMSCSPVGPGGFTGCTQQMLDAARAERGSSLLEF